MRFIHLADLHIGKKVNEFSMIEDQHFVLKQVLGILDSRQIDGVILAGDIYDKVIPSAEAVQLLDWFLTELAKRGKPVYMVSGNHDSGERLAFGARLLERSQVYVAAVFDGRLEPIVLEDEYGALNLYLLPFIKPAHVRKALRERKEAQNAEEDALDIQTYQQAIETVLEMADIQPEKRNLLVAHQMVTGAARCDSEELSVGGIDNVDAALFENFDYVALGHIHGPQSMTRDTIRYAGTLLKYSFSECSHNKSVTIVDIREKGNVVIETLPVKPLHDMRQIRGEYDVLMSRDFYQGKDRQDYLKVILTDEEDVPEALGRLRTVYPNIMKLEYDNTRTKQSVNVQEMEAAESKSPLNYFGEFYEMQNNQKLSEAQQQLVADLIEQIWEDKK